jgi:Protein of unknown function (DUF3141)
MRCEERTLDDIRALGGNDAEDERRFAAAAKVSEINLALYRTFPATLRTRHAVAARVGADRKSCTLCGCHTRPFQMTIRSWRQ